jgi:phage terminase Nu1 subunit (DNA packaging protein)
MTSTNAIGRNYNVSEVAVLLKTSVPTVHKWLQQGAPFITKANRDKAIAWELDLAAIVQWREDKAVARATGALTTLDIDEAKARKETARAGMAEIELAKARGEVVAIEVVTKIVGEQLAAVRAKLFGIPSKAAPVVASLSETLECREALDLLIREACDELVGVDSGGIAASGGITDASDPDDDLFEYEAPAAPERKRVGRPRKTPLG